MSRRLRVLWLIKGLGPGGAERLLVTAAGARDSAAFDYRVAYLLPWKNHLVPELESVGVPARCLEVRNERDVRWAIALRRLLVEEGIDVLHVHSPYPAGIARVVVRTIPSDRRPRVVSTEHNGWPTFTPTTRFLNGITLAMGDASIAVSEQVRDSVWSRLRRRVETIRHGVPLACIQSQRRERDAARDELGIDPDAVLVGTVANYNMKKDYPTLLHAFRHVASRFPSARFCAIGQGPLENEILALRRQLDLEGVMELPGYRVDAVRLMAAFDVFVLASRVEGLPVVLMEALALGLPVVATAVGGVPEAVRAGVEGVLVPPGRPGQMGAAIGELVTDPDRRAALGRAATRRGEEFDIASAVERIESIYRQVAGR